MIQAQHRLFHTAFLNLYTRLRIRWHFKEVVIHHDLPSLGEKAVLLIGNHFSWWDGFVAQFVNLQCLGKRFHVMMLEEELRKRHFLSYAGAFSIQPNARTMLQSLSYASDIMRDPDNLLLIYPQGKIQSVHHRPLRFASGWTRMLDALPEWPLVIFMVVLPDYGSSPKPMLHVYLQAFGEYDTSRIEPAFNAFMEQCTHNQVVK